ncbi:MAG: F0F1 ATP synthase subunit B [Deltaproteobacteria bacterium]|nr:F0F1 ATP synthase subunit B [Deltaproteobacteria bacterium]MBW2071737.1 F0F1 ATP synthase subunit B [Deltaproteobacteria bacterium]
MIEVKRRRSPGMLPLVIWAVLLVLFWLGTSWAAEAGGHGGTSKWPDFWFRVLNFSLLVGILYYVARKPIKQFFAKRTQTIAGTLAELKAKKQEAEKTFQEYNQKLAQLDKETERIIQEYIEQGEAEKAKIIASAEKAAAEIRQQAELAIQQEIKTAKASLQQEIAELSVATAEKVLKEKIEPEDQQKLVNDFMTKVVETK